MNKIQEEFEIRANKMGYDLTKRDDNTYNCVDTLLLEIGYLMAIDDGKNPPEADCRWKEWINIKEKLPEKQGCYLVNAPLSFPKNSTYLVAEFYEDNKIFYSASSDAPLEDVTHWMPIPEAPDADYKEGKK